MVCTSNLPEKADSPLYLLPWTRDIRLDVSCCLWGTPMPQRTQHDHEEFRNIVSGQGKQIFRRSGNDGKISIKIPEPIRFNPKPSLVYSILLLVICLIPSVFFAYIIVATIVGQIPSKVPFWISVPAFIVFSVCVGVHVYFTRQKVLGYKVWCQINADWKSAANKNV